MQFNSLKLYLKVIKHIEYKANIIRSNLLVANGSTSFNLHLHALLLLLGAGYSDRLVPAILNGLVHTHLVSLLPGHLLSNVITVSSGDWLANSVSHILSYLVRLLLAGLLRLIYTNLSWNLVMNVIANFLGNRATDLVINIVAHIFLNNLRHLPRYLSTRFSCHVLT